MKDKGIMSYIYIGIWTRVCIEKKIMSLLYMQWYCGSDITVLQDLLKISVIQGGRAPLL